MKAHAIDSKNLHTGNQSVKRVTEDKTMTNSKPLTALLNDIGKTIATNGREVDPQDAFAIDNYQLLRDHKVFSALVPTEFGGGGRGYSEMCEFLTALAGHHPSTALSCSMHQHIVAANRYNHIHGRPGQALLEKVAARELVLVSTGAGDWLASNGELTKTDGGYLYSGTKHFASGSPGADVLVTSGPFEDPEEGWQVLHFPVPLNAEGVTILDNWRPLGMCGTGSNSVQLKDVFIAEETVAARRPRGDYHMMWSVILPVALPLIMSVYLGVAKSAAEKARKLSADSQDPATPYLLGEMENALTTAAVMVKDMINICDNFEFTADLNTVDEIVKRKTIAAAACKETTAKAVEVCGGHGFMRTAGLEALLRDSMASHFHPLQEKRQLLFTGSLSMGKEPPSQAF